MAELIIAKFGRIGTKSVLRLAERATATAQMIAQMDGSERTDEGRITALTNILDDLTSDEAVASSLCEVL
jgi:hypothetical protein